MSKYFIHLLMYSTAETTQLYIKKLGISAEIKIFGKLHDGFVIRYCTKKVSYTSRNNNQMTHNEQRKGSVNTF